jgi:hypothetical protein
VRTAVPVWFFRRQKIPVPAQEIEVVSPLSISDFHLQVMAYICKPQYRKTDLMPRKVINGRSEGAVNAHRTRIPRYEVNSRQYGATVKTRSPQRAPRLACRSTL